MYGRYLGFFENEQEMQVLMPANLVSRGFGSYVFDKNSQKKIGLGEWSRPMGYVYESGALITFGENSLGSCCDRNMHIRNLIYDPDEPEYAWPI